MGRAGIVITVAKAVLIFLFCAFFFESLLTALVVFSILGALSFMRKNIDTGVRFRNATIYLVMFLLTIGVYFLNNHIAQKNAGKIINAVEAYTEKNGTYPKDLSDLVPEYIPSVPRVKYTINANSFKYETSEKGHILVYTKKPPYGKVYYSFEEKKWRKSD